MLRLKTMISLILPITMAFAPIAQAATDNATEKTKIAAEVKKEHAKSILEQKNKSVKQKTKQLKLMSVNVNSASAKQLMLGLKGIGKQKAQAIVDYRKTNGAFKTNDDLLKVKGIGKKILKKNKKRIRLSGKTAI
jgi:competence ComEA-like helix-hairpin-helix protein